MRKAGKEAESISRCVFKQDTAKCHWLLNPQDRTLEKPYHPDLRTTRGVGQGWRQGFCLPLIRGLPCVALGSHFKVAHVLGKVLSRVLPVSLGKSWGKSDAVSCAHVKSIHMVSRQLEEEAGEVERICSKAEKSLPHP